MEAREALVSQDGHVWPWILSLISMAACLRPRFTPRWRQHRWLQAQSSFTQCRTQWCSGGVIICTHMDSFYSPLVVALPGFMKRRHYYGSTRRVSGHSTPTSACKQATVPNTWWLGYDSVHRVRQGRHLDSNACLLLLQQPGSGPTGNSDVSTQARYHRQRGFHRPFFPRLTIFPSASTGYLPPVFFARNFVSFELSVTFPLCTSAFWLFQLSELTFISRLVFSSIKRTAISNSYLHLFPFSRSFIVPLAKTTFPFKPRGCHGPPRYYHLFKDYEAED